MYSARKNEPVFESESDWDSTTEAQSPTPRASSNAPKIEFYSDEEENVKPANVKIKADHNNSTGRVRIGLAEETAGGSKASSGRSSPATVKSAGRKHDALQAVTFTDRGQLSDDEDADRPTPRPRIASPENPPYDFSAAITEPRNTPQPQYDAPPGKDRKGSSYDPKTRQSRLGSWDDSEGEEQTLAQLRENFEKGNKEKKISNNKETVEKPTWKDKLKNNKQQKNSSKKEKSTDCATSRSPNRSSKPSPVDSPTYSHDIKDDYIISVRDRNSKDFSSPPANSTWPAVTPPDKPTSYRRDEYGNYVYYFAEERTEYLYAIEDKTDIKMEQISQKVLPFVTRGAKEFFGVFQLVLSIIMIFVVEAIKFVLRSILYPLIYGVFNGLGDYVFKPMFAATFNCCIQPYLMVLFNVMLGCRTICGPLIDIFRSCAHVCVIMLKVWRLCPISITNNNHSRYVESIQDV